MAGSHLAEYVLAHHPEADVFGTYRWRSKLDNLEELGRAGRLNPLQPNALQRGDVRQYVQPGSLIEKAARGMRHIKRAVRADLARFKAYVLMEEEETGAWRGAVEDGDVKKQRTSSSRRKTSSSARSRSSSRSKGRSSSSSRSRGSSNGRSSSGRTSARKSGSRS